MVDLRSHLVSFKSFFCFVFGSTLLSFGAFGSNLPSFGTFGSTLLHGFSLISGETGSMVGDASAANGGSAQTLRGRITKLSTQMIKI